MFPTAIFILPEHGPSRKASGHRALRVRRTPRRSRFARVKWIAKYGAPANVV